MRKPIVCGLTASLLVGGCYTYREPPATGVAPGREVRVLLTDAGTAAVAPWVGPRVVSIAGRLTTRSDSALTLAVTATGKRNGTEDLWKGEPVVVRRDHVETLQERSFSRRRSLAAGGVAVAVTALLYAILGGSLGSSGGPGGGPSGGR